MLTPKEKLVLISEAHRMKNDPASINIIHLIDWIIDETRKENDTVSPDRVLYNQGIIGACSKIKEHMERGLPTLGRA